jgi:2-dehydro-3-deoxyphosphogluconate aldolase/(4S)-4-hydroxy-2-oxoglutarate aldolase
MTVLEMQEQLDELFGNCRVMAILRNLPPGETVRLATTAWDLGIDLVEVPVQTPDAVPALEAAIRAGEERGRTVGAGTVTSVEQVHAVVSLGARFSVAPGFDASVVAACTTAGLPHLPGVATPTEIQAATAHGLRWLKAFPASVLGAGWFTAMRGPFPDLQLVATGGVDADNAGAFFAAGVRAVAVGSALADPRQLEKLTALLGAPVSS